MGDPTRYGVDMRSTSVSTGSVRSGSTLSADAAAALPPLGSPTAVSAYLDVPVGTLTQWRYRGLGPKFLKVGRHVRYRREDVLAWLEELAQA